METTKRYTPDFNETCMSIWFLGTVLHVILASKLAPATTIIQKFYSVLFFNKING